MRICRLAWDNKLTQRNSTSEHMPMCNKSYSSFVFFLLQKVDFHIPEVWQRNAQNGVWLWTKNKKRAARPRSICIYCKSIIIIYLYYFSSILFIIHRIWMKITFMHSPMLRTEIRAPFKTIIVLLCCLFAVRK